MNFPLDFKADRWKPHVSKKHAGELNRVFAWYIPKQDQDRNHENSIIWCLPAMVGYCNKYHTQGRKY